MNNCRVGCRRYSGKWYKRQASSIAIGQFYHFRGNRTRVCYFDCPIYGCAALIGTAGVGDIHIKLRSQPVGSQVCCAGRMRFMTAISVMGRNAELPAGYAGNIHLEFDRNLLCRWNIRQIIGERIGIVKFQYTCCWGIRCSRCFITARIHYWCAAGNKCYAWWQSDIGIQIKKFCLCAGIFQINPDRHIFGTGVQSIRCQRAIELRKCFRRFGTRGNAGGNHTAGFYSVGKSRCCGIIISDSTRSQTSDFRADIIGQSSATICKIRFYLILICRIFWKIE